MEFEKLEEKLINVGATKETLEKQGFKYSGPADILHQFQYENKTYFFNDIKVGNRTQYKLYSVVENGTNSSKNK